MSKQAADLFAGGGWTFTLVLAIEGKVDFIFTNE
jgi:hypothetical protein